MHAPSAITNVRLLSFVLLFSGVFFAVAPLTHAQLTQDEQDIADSTNEQLTANSTLSNNGIFGCLGQGARVAIAGQQRLPSNVGTTRAIGGVYVPVNDAAVTLNTGFLVYKECILDGMARKIAESGTSELGRQAFTAFQQGRQGQAQYLQNFPAFFLPYNIRITTDTVQTAQNGPICAAFKNRVATAVARTVAYSFNGTASSLACSFASDADRLALINRTVPVNWNSFMNLVAGDYELARYYQLQSQNESRMAAFNEDMRQMIMMGRGVIPIFDNSQNPLAMNVVTPGFIIADAISQITGSGFRQLEQANEIDQIVANLWGGLSTRLLSSGSGVPGLFVTTGTQPAYINRMVAETQAAVRAGAVNAAVIALAGYRQSEAAYLEAKQGTANAILNAIVQLRTYENQCWDLIIPAVQAHAQTQGNPTLSIATSTQFSQAVIDDPANNIRALASTTAVEVAASQQALAQIDQLIAQVTNSGSSAAQQQALLQIDQMVQNGQLHTQQDAQNATDQRGAVTSALNTLLNNTRTAWGDNTDPNIGWCNVSANNPNRQSVIDRWFNAWR
ncbi:MAG TPA: hypothetical protein VNM40_04110 [Candidatus Paceibacterota bacterium]|nr:hypothetical protein [Candidatus Paceibacterota bacterium]